MAFFQYCWIRSLLGEEQTLVEVLNCIRVNVGTKVRAQLAFWVKDSEPQGGPRKGPGIMLLAEEYRFRMCLLQVQCSVSLDFGWKWRPGNLSEQVEHIDACNVAMFA